MMDEEIERPDRAIVFVDGNNLYHRLKERGWPTFIRIGDLAQRLVGERRLVRTYYYNAYPPGDAKHSARGNTYLALLKGTPGIVFRPSRLQQTMKADEHGQYRSYVEKGADTAISADMVQCAADDEYDVAILVSSDGDFAPVADTGRRIYHKRVEVVYFRGTRPFVMEKVALMRQFRQGLVRELDYRGTRGRRRNRLRRPS